MVAVGWMARLTRHVGAVLVALVLGALLYASVSGGRSTPASASGSTGQAGRSSIPATLPEGIGTAPPSVGRPSETASATPAPSVVTVGELGAAPIGRVEKARVVRVVDGDTIVVDRGRGPEKLRYIGMDTPETVDPRRPVEPMGHAAAAANQALVGGRTVWLEKDVSETDRYGRLLRDVWLRDPSRPSGWLFVNLELVAEGYAQVTTYPPDVRYVDALLAAQRAAREAGLGLWAEPSASGDAGTSPIPFVGGGGGGGSGGSGGSGCQPSYSPCLPIVDDLDCADVRAMGLAPVRVEGPDVYRLDRDGDGLGCE